MYLNKVHIEALKKNTEKEIVPIFKIVLIFYMKIAIICLRCFHVVLLLAPTHVDGHIHYTSILFRFSIVPLFYMVPIFYIVLIFNIRMQDWREPNGQTMKHTPCLVTYNTCNKSHEITKLFIIFSTTRILVVVYPLPGPLLVGKSDDPACGPPTSQLIPQAAPSRQQGMPTNPLVITWCVCG